MMSEIGVRLWTIRDGFDEVPPKRSHSGHGVGLKALNQRRANAAALQSRADAIRHIFELPCPRTRSSGHRPRPDARGRRPRAQELSPTQTALLRIDGRMDVPVVGIQIPSAKMRPEDRRSHGRALHHPIWKEHET